MKRVTLLDISELIWNPYPRIEDVLYFVNRPLQTFIGYLLCGVGGGYVWSADPVNDAEHRTKIVDVLADEWERLNISDERSGFFSGSTNFSSTYECVEYFTNLYSQRLLAMLAPSADMGWRVVDYRIEQNYVYMTIESVRLEPLC